MLKIIHYQIRLYKDITKHMLIFGVDFIEVGYLGVLNEYNPSCVSLEYLDFITNDVNHNNVIGKLVVMINPSKFKNEYIDILKDERVGMIRFTVAPEFVELSKSIFMKLKDIDIDIDIDIEISANITRASKLTSEKITQIAKELADAGDRYIYLVDSNGSMTPNKVKNLIEVNLKYWKSSSVLLLFVLLSLTPAFPGIIAYLIGWILMKVPNDYNKHSNIMN